MSIRFDPLFRLRHVFSSKMDSLAWLRYAQSALFSPLRGKMLTHFILPESLGFSERTPEAYANLSCGRFVLCEERITVDSRVCRIRFDPLFRLRHVFSSKMDSLAWLRYAGAGHANRRGGKPPRLAKPMRLPPKLPMLSLISCGVKC